MCMQYTDFIIDIVIIKIYCIKFKYQYYNGYWLVSIFIVSAIFTTMIAWIINISSYVLEFMACNV